jgi:arsenate reductase-like glutaredoxin family protein
MYKVYGIPNCDVIKKAGKWLEQRKIAFDFHDYKQHGISAEKLAEWCKQVGWETKRPVVEHNGKVVAVGFNETTFQEIFGK